jgi:glycosyltransferase involved in cell wall biosynthesis
MNPSFMPNQANVSIVSEPGTKHFSIIIPAKNEQEHISQCISAISRLNYPKDEFEIIVVDNGSTDETVSILRKEGLNVYEKPDITLGELRNFGAAVARGEFLAFLDADCIVDPDWLSNARNALRDPTAGCTGSTPLAPINGPWVERVWSSFRTRRSEKSYTSWINSSNFIVRKSLFNKIGGFDPGLKTCEDVDICMRLRDHGKVLFDPAIKVIHLGEPKTIRQFFLKEVWRGKGNISGIVNHGITLSELKSIALPLYYCILPIAILCVLASNGHSAITILAAFAAYLAPPLLYSLWVMLATREYRYFPGYFFLFLIYANARALALFCR